LDKWSPLYFDLINPIRFFMSVERLTFILVGSLILFSSCSSKSNEELARRLDKRNDAYFNWQERRKLRQQARDERYQAWFDRIMD
jgi:hypothetical protein